MNRAEYMRELAYLLQDVPDEEKEEALQYYEDYFDDAGPENEGRVIEELGRPEKIAAIIRDGAKNGYENQDAEYTEKGYQNERYRGPQYKVVPPSQSGQEEKEREPFEEKWEDSVEDEWEDASYRKQTSGTERKRRRLHPILWIGVIFLAIMLLPVLAGGAAIFFGILVTAVCAVGGIALAVILIAVVLLVGGVIFIGVGIAKLFVFPVAGMMIGGAGLVIFAVGMLFCWLAVLVCGKMIPGVFHAVGNFFNFLTRRFRRGGAAF